MTQWWLVMISPSGETKEAEHPPRLTTAPRGKAVGSVSLAGSSSKPALLSDSACVASWFGIHMPPGFSKVAVAGWAASTVLACASAPDDGAATSPSLVVTQLSVRPSPRAARTERWGSLGRWIEPRITARGSRFEPPSGPLGA